MTRALLASALKRAAFVHRIDGDIRGPGLAPGERRRLPFARRHLVVAFPAGGGVDTVGRVVAQKLGDALGQQVIVVNKPARAR